MQRYTLFEDLQGMTIASAQAALGIHLLRAGGLVTGGTAGTALILSYATGWNFSLVFFLLNLPFFAFAYWAKGPVFFVKNIATVVIVSLLAEALVPLVQVGSIHPAAAALLFGVSTGVGLLGLFRHAASLGGVSIVALVVQERYGFRAAYTQLAYDAAIFAAAFFIMPADRVAWSILGALAVNAIIAFNHRRDWYVVT